MYLIKPYYEILTNIEGQKILKNIEKIARTCYKSEQKIKEGSAETLIKALIKNDHTAMIEHESISVRFICDRGVSHEMVRHRIASFAQESTRYVDYSGEITFIIPCWLNLPEGKYEWRFQENDFTFNGNFMTYQEQDSLKISNDKNFIKLLQYAELGYKALRYTNNWKPQEARAVLPNASKTEIVVTANLREWRNIFKLRTDKAAHPQMRELMIPLLKEIQEKIPIIFDDIIV